VLNVVNDDDIPPDGSAFDRIVREDAQRMLGACADGSKELVALRDCCHESGESRADLLRAAPAGACAAPCSRSAMAPWAVGRPSARCSLASASRGAGFTGFLRGCPGLQAGEESDSCGAGQG
jgi:hypothetical protein